jgi:hypothetical protein
MALEEGIAAADVDAIRGGGGPAAARLAALVALTRALIALTRALIARRPPRRGRPARLPRCRLPPRAGLDEIFAYPGVPEAWRNPVVGALLPFVPVSFVKAERRFDYFSTVTTLGTPQDITVQEIRIACFFPANAATAEAARAL